VIDGDIKAAAGFGVEETVEAIVFHKMWELVQYHIFKQNKTFL